MLSIRRSEARGHAQHGWLDSHHTFSFASYYDPAHMGFRALRVINEDRVEPGAGFGTHGHQNMEIISYVLEGALAHRDSMGNGSSIRPGDVQVMSAGRGVTHSEFNGSKAEGVHFLQIWIQPNDQNTPPSYAERSFPFEERRNHLRLLVSADARDGSLAMRQDASLYGALLDADHRLTHTLALGRHAWVQVVEGEVQLNGQTLRTGDGAAVSDEVTLDLLAVTPAELLLFDLA